MIQEAQIGTEDVQCRSCHGLGHTKSLAGAVPPEQWQGVSRARAPPAPSLLLTMKNSRESAGRGCRRPWNTHSQICARKGVAASFRHLISASLQPKILTLRCMQITLTASLVACNLVDCQNSIGMAHEAGVMHRASSIPHEWLSVSSCCLQGREQLPAGQV